MTRIALVALVAAAIALASPAWADSRGIAIRNATNETITGIHLAPAGSGRAGENRMRSQLPPGVSARFGYSTGCRADLRIDFASGRTEDHADIDMCRDGTVVAGSGGVEGPKGAATASLAKPTAMQSTPAKATPAAVTRAPPPVVPPWTGKSITKRFGGMD